MDGGPRRREPVPEAPLAKLGPPPTPMLACDESVYGAGACGWGCAASECPCDVPVREEWRLWRCDEVPGYALGGPGVAPGEICGWG